MTGDVNVVPGTSRTLSCSLNPTMVSTDWFIACVLAPALPAQALRLDQRRPSSRIADK